MSRNYFQGNTDFVKRYNDKWAQYSTLTAQAQTIHREMGGVPSRQEGQKYDEAAAVCDEIIGMNQQSPAIVSMWKMRRRSCENKRDEIVAYIRQTEKLDEPKAPVAPAGADPVDGANPSGADPASAFSSRNASEYVPAEMIRSWYQPCPEETVASLSGMDEAVKDLLKGLDQMKFKLTAAAAKKAPPHGYFLYGPPGTGKTHLVHAIANKLMTLPKEERYQYLEVKCQDIQDPYRGVAEKIANAAFAEAMDLDRAILFFDEFDAVCASRADDVKQYDRSLTNAFLQCRNKLQTTKNHVIVMVATNYPDRVDPAMVQWFKRIRIPLPDLETREKHFENQLKDFPMEEGLTAKEMAEQTDNYSYRDMNKIIDSVRSKIIEEAICRNEVLADGQVDAEATDKAAADAIVNRQIVLTSEMYESAFRKNPPTNISDNRAALERYEAGIQNG